MAPGTAKRQVRNERRQPVRPVVRGERVQSPLLPDSACANPIFAPPVVQENADEAASCFAAPWPPVLHTEFHQPEAGPA